jgi:predicted MarR family transcription regulator
MAVLASLIDFRHLIEGFKNQELVANTAALLNQPYTSRQATYDLRRLKRKQLIRAIGNSRRYEATPLGRRVAVLFTKAYCRVLAPGLVDLDPALPDCIAQRSALACAWRRFDRTLAQFIEKSLIAA